MQNSLFDSHTHLQWYDGKKIQKDGTPTPPLEAVIKQASQVGVTHFICNATCEDDWQQVLSISTKYPNIYVALGIHPWYMNTLKPDWNKRLDKLLQDHPSLMIGEIGLDKNKPDMWTQENVFRIQLELAHKHRRPAIIHCVRAWDRLLHIFKDESQAKKMPPKILSHSHQGNTDLIPELIEKYNAYFSYSSIVLPVTHPKVRACLKATPLDRILVESDAPDLTPFPADVAPLLTEMAKITGHDEALLRQVTFQNAKEFVK